MDDFFAPVCRKHGRGCAIRWGYDQDHSDTDRPYTLDELADRSDGPHFYAYPSHDEYVAGWQLWKALLRDSRPTTAEQDAADSARLARLGINAGSIMEALDQRQQMIQGWVS